MSVLFLSHSSQDDAAATALEAWLRGRGFTDIFVDHSAIAGGEKWAQALRDASGACRVVVCLVTENWLGDTASFGEAIPTVIFGPGGPPVYCPDEHLTVDDIVEATKVYAAYAALALGDEGAASS